MSAAVSANSGVRGDIGEEQRLWLVDRHRDSGEPVTASPEAVICSRTVTWSKEPYRHACEGQAVDLPTSFTAHAGSQPAVRAFMRCVAVILSPRRDVDQTAAVGTAESDAANDIRKEENGL